MSNPGEDLKNIFASVTGWNVDFAGIVLGIILAAAILVSFLILFSILKREGKFDMLVAGGFAVFIPALLTWFPLWVPFFLVFLVLAIMFGPRFAGGGGGD